MVEPYRRERVDFSLWNSNVFSLFFFFLEGRLPHPIPASFHPDLTNLEENVRD